MEVFNSVKSADGVKDLYSVRAYKGDAMTLLCFDVDESLIEELAGFTIKYTNPDEDQFLYNRMTFSDAFLVNNPQIPRSDRKSSLYSPFQRFSWIHVPRTQNDGSEPFFGTYDYQVTPRYIKNGRLEDLDPAKTVHLKIDLSPYDLKNTRIGFTRGFMSSAGYVSRFGLENKKVRPPDAENVLLFDVKRKSGTSKRFNAVTRRYENVDFTYEEQHQWMGWQARQRTMEFLEETIADPSLTLKVFAYDLDEPEVARLLLLLASENRLQIILDNAGDHGDAGSMETQFENEFKLVADPARIFRGSYKALAHKKIFIQLRNNNAVKVLTGSTNFSTNGLYINANHLLIFNNAKIAARYEEIFDNSLGAAKMGIFRGTLFSKTDYEFNEPGMPKFSLTFAPHPKTDAERIFARVSQRIKAAESDVFFAIMNDTSKSSILDAVREQVRSDQVYTYGITDTIGANNDDYGVFIYKPNLKRGVRVAAKGIKNILPPPLGEVPTIPKGYAIHHKFVVVDFKGKDPVVYCGSSNLAFGPEQRNGDNLLEIHDEDVATAFAIEAGRLVDHFQWRNKEITQTRMDLSDLGVGSERWYKKYYNPDDLRCLEREKFISSRPIV